MLTPASAANSAWYRLLKLLEIFRSKFMLVKNATTIVLSTTNAKSVVTSAEALLREWIVIGVWTESKRSGERLPSAARRVSKANQ